MTPQKSPLRPWLLLGGLLLLMVGMNLPNGLTPEFLRQGCAAAIQSRMDDRPAQPFIIDGEPQKRQFMRDYTMDFRLRGAEKNTTLAVGRCITMPGHRGEDIQVVISQWQTPH